MDAEWNISRRMGVSTIQLCPHFDPLAVYIIRVHRLSSLPPSLLRLLTSERVWKIGSRIKGDLTRLKKQFPSQLDDNTRFSTIDLKDLARSRGLIQPRQSGSLAALCDAILGLELPKDPKIRANNNWEFSTISPALLYYAACDVAASRHIFEAMFDHTLSITEQTLPTSLDDGSEGAQVDVQVIEAEADVEVFYVKESRYL
ncbi:hypothetical protein BDP27DRAFT_1318788 [Rhodocollybia butyracea]|uniref:3'-5' exonuclease n=1 Tax=Rhodocollybia butyracea TaxID=206335 RepID=A0A9P5Q0Q3_9AGAR|nr:hypothetical protein BDP27DRAFT_1318788 [Rhodocollybia butyracea]